MRWSYRIYNRTLLWGAGPVSSMVVPMSKEQWIADVERTQERFADGKLTAEEFAEEMKSMGFDPHEIADMIQEVEDANK